MLTFLYSPPFCHQWLYHCFLLTSLHDRHLLYQRCFALPRMTVLGDTIMTLARRLLTGTSCWQTLRTQNFTRENIKPQTFVTTLYDSTQLSYIHKWATLPPFVNTICCLIFTLNTIPFSLLLFASKVPNHSFTFCITSRFSSSFSLLLSLHKAMTHLQAKNSQVNSNNLPML